MGQKRGLLGPEVPISRGERPAAGGKFCDFEGPKMSITKGKSLRKWSRFDPKVGIQETPPLFHRILVRRGGVPR